MLTDGNTASTPPDVAIGLNAAIAGTETFLDDEVESLAHALTVKFEELTLIHQLSERLKLDEDSDLICQSLLEELEPCVGTVTIAIDLFADEESQYEAQLHQAVTQDEHHDPWADPSKVFHDGGSPDPVEEPREHSEPEEEREEVLLEGAVHLFLRIVISPD